MRIGCCVNMVALAPDGIGIERLATLTMAGYDYVELPLAQMMALGKGQFSALVEYVASSGIPCEACNNFIPAEYALTGDKTDPVRLADYLDEALERASRLGAQSIVFGSAGAKNVPPGFPLEKAWEQIVQTLQLIDKKIGNRDIKIAIEPLCRLESNIVTTAQEGLKLARDVDRKNIRLLIDYYHLCTEKEEQTIIDRAKDYLQHIHLANPAGRSFPAAGDEVDYRTFIGNLKKAGYDKRVSIEAYTDTFSASAAAALAAIRDADRATGDRAP